MKDHQEYIPESRRAEHEAKVQALKDAVALFQNREGAVRAPSLSPISV